MPNRLTLDDLLTPEQAADRLGLTVETIRQYARPSRKRRGMPHLRPVPGIRVLRFDPAEVDRFFSATRSVGRPKS